MPMAVIRTASRGELRKGLYATRSIPTLIKPHADHRDEQGQEHPDDLEDGPAVVRHGAEEAQARERAGEHGDAYEGADHEVVAVGEVDELDDAVDQRVAEGDERDDRPVGDPDQELRDELARVLYRLR